MRAELHEGCSRWLAQKGGEFDELVAYHLEQAVRFRSELGPLDAHGQDLAARGGNLLATAARSASARGDMPAAVGLFERSVLGVLPHDAGVVMHGARVGALVSQLPEVGPVLFLVERAELALQVTGAAIVLVLVTSLTR